MIYLIDDMRIKMHFEEVGIEDVFETRGRNKIG